MLTKRLKELRRSAGLTQRVLSAEMGININTLASYERGLREPNFSTLVKFARFFDCTTDYLLGVSDMRTTKPDAKDKIIQEFTAECNELKKQIKETNVALSKVVDIYHALSGRHSA